MEYLKKNNIGVPEIITSDKNVCQKKKEEKKTRKEIWNTNNSFQLWQAPTQQHEIEV